MAKTRIFQIAKELNISHTDILSYLKSRKVDVSSHMSPVDDNIRKLIMNEFAKDKEQVDRFRKEQVRKEIHDTKLKEKQQSTKKLELLSLTEQRELEKLEKAKKEKEEEEAKKRKEEKKQVEEVVKKKEKVKPKDQKKYPSNKAKELKKKFKPSRRLRSINLDDIQTKIGVGTSKKPGVKKTHKVEASQSVKEKVKDVLAQIDKKTKKKTYKKKSYYYNLKKSIASETFMLVISEDFAFTGIN